MEISSKLPERLKELMEERDLRSETLAQGAGIAGSSIRSWPRGASVPSFESAVKLADFFGCSLDFLAGRSENFAAVAPKTLPPFYPRLRAVMAEARTTRFRVAKDTQIKDAFFTNWARGEKPLLVTLCILADYLDVTLDYLVGRTEY